MNATSRFWPLLILIALAAAGFVAFDRYLALDSARTALSETRDQLDESSRLAATHPKAFGLDGKQGRVSLKNIVQETSARHGIPIVYLTETEKDVGDKVRERSVIARAVNAPHGKFVRFLAELELKGNGAKIKELRLKPSVTQPGIYQEAEAVFSHRHLAEESPEPRKGAHTETAQR